MPSRRTKIVATIGPASDSPDTLRGLIEAGMDTVRLGLAHGPVEDSIERMERVRSAAEQARAHIGIMADLPGPKVRSAAFGDDGVILTEDSRVRLVPAEPGARSTAETIAVDHPDVVVVLEPGDVVALGDGGVTLVIEQVEEEVATARVVGGGRLRGRPGVNVPPERLDVASPTEDDLRLLEAVSEAGVDAVALSFVRDEHDVERLRSAIGPGGPMVVAKIETAAAVDHLDAIIQASDGVMVARGDLGVRLPIEDVPHIQKRIIRTSVAWGRPVITATQMLESMVLAPTPTRAEVTDVANAVFDGTSALMLSGETAVGHHPIAAVATMARIAERAERDFDYLGWGRGLGRQQTANSEHAPASLRMVAAVTAAAWRAAHDAHASAIVCGTRSGATARAVARFRPTAPILAVTPSPRTARHLSMAWGVRSVVTDVHASVDDIVWFGVKAAVEEGVARPGDIVVVLAGAPEEGAGTTDVLRLVQVS